MTPVTRPVFPATNRASNGQGNLTMTKTLLNGGPNSLGLISNGLIAGAIVGVFIAILHFWLLQPIIVEAERYELGELALPTLSVDTYGATSAEAKHSHADHESNITRNSLTILFLMLIWCGFGLLMGAALKTIELMTKEKTPSGLILGIIGFAAFMAFPALGLPPEPPGMPAAKLFDRQIWWIATATATLLGSGLILLRTEWPAYITAAAIIALPHFIGTPIPHFLEPPIIPPELAALFAARTIGLALIGWLALGLLLEHFLKER